MLCADVYKGPASSFAEMCELKALGVLTIQSITFASGIFELQSGVTYLRNVL